MNEKISETLRKIEQLEHSWEYVLSDEESAMHSFGRVPEDGNSVSFWSVPKSTGEFLQCMVELLGAKVVLELGCSVGYSTLFLAAGVQKTSGHIFTTEILSQKIFLAKEHFCEAGVDSVVTLFDKDIVEVLQEWKEEKIDLVFMDADKEKYSDYFELLLPLLNEKGIIIVDNAGKVRMRSGELIDSEHIKEFVKKVHQDKRVECFFLDADNGLLLIKKLHD